MKPVILAINSIVIFWMFHLAAGFAQNAQTLAGTVTDPGGAVVAGAMVSLHRADGSAPLRVATDSAGAFRFESVGSGSFVVEADSPGFRHFSRTIRLDAGNPLLEENVRLEVATLNETLVVTTATRNGMDVDKAPVSASLVTRQELETRNIHQIDEAINLTEGVISVRAKGPADNDFGVGLRGFSGMGGQYRTLILMDGQPMNNSFIGNVNWSTFSVSEMERVEVARGPFSSLYGGNAMGGVVNLVTRPVERREIELFGQYGNRDTTNYSVRLADRFFGKLGLGLGYSRFQTGGYSPQEVLRTLATATGGIPVTGVRRWQTPYGGVNYQVGEQGRNWFNQEAVRVRGEYAPSSKFFVSAQWMRQSRSSGYDAYLTSLRDAANNPVDSGTVSFVEDGIVRGLTVTPANFIGLPTGARTNIVQTTVLGSLSASWSLRASAGLNHNPSDWYASPAANATLSSGGGSFANTSSQGIYGNVQASRQSSGESLIFGAETRHDRARSAGQPIPNYAIRTDGGAFDTQAFGKAINQAGYIQYQRNVSEHLNLIAGGRWDYWKTYDGGNQNATGQPISFYSDRSRSALTGKLAASYALPRGWQVRGSVGNAFRSPTVYELYRDFAFFGSLLLGNPNVKPERLLAYEGGMGRAFGNGHSVNLSLYENRISDLIYRVTDLASDPTGRTRRLDNAGLARTRGVELSAQQRVTSWLHFRQAYTYANSVITKNDRLPATVGKRAPWVPRNTLAYFVTASRGRWNSTWTGRYVDAMFSSGDNTDVTRGVPGSYDMFFEMGASLTVEINKRTSFVFNADNLLDRRYHEYYLAQGRSLFAGFRVRFN
jgi:iron complex outermembrane recepter protein